MLDSRSDWDAKEPQMSSVVHESLALLEIEMEAAHSERLDTVAKQCAAMMKERVWVWAQIYIILYFLLQFRLRLRLGLRRD